MKAIIFGLMVVLSSTAFAEEDHCLALNIYHEARGEGIEGWLAVAFVTVNRLQDKRFPDTVCDVVYDSYQFSWTHDDIPDEPVLEQKADRQAWKYINQFAKGFLDNYEFIVDPTAGSLYYHSLKVKPYWAKYYKKVGAIGQHIFYVE